MLRDNIATYPFAISTPHLWQKRLLHAASLHHHHSLCLALPARHFGSQIHTHSYTHSHSRAAISVPSSTLLSYISTAPPHIRPASPWLRDSFVCFSQFIPFVIFKVWKWNNLKRAPARVPACSSIVETVPRVALPAISHHHHQHSVESHNAPSFSLTTFIHSSGSWCVPL